MTEMKTPIPPPATATFRFRLYVAGSSPRSLRAVEVMERLCREEFTRAELEIVDIYKVKPGQDTGAIVLTAPAVVRLTPQPRVRYYGDFSDEKNLRATLAVNPCPSGMED